MLIFGHQDGHKVASPEPIQIWMKQTMDWIGGIAAQNIIWKQVLHWLKQIRTNRQLKLK